jgi:EpsI family protein
MPKALTALRFLRGGPALLVTVVLLVQIAVFYALPTAEYVPHPPPLKEFQHQIGPWTMVRETEIDPDSQALLRADDTVSRSYVGPRGPLSLFVAFFRSQRGGVTPHSPKICLPGAGWTPEASRIIAVSMPGEAGPIPLNRYIVRYGENRSLVLYWYSTAHHVVADEYLSKLYLMYEGLRYHRSDEAVYRVIAPIDQAGEERAESDAVQFVQSFYPPLKHQMWME